MILFASFYRHICHSHSHSTVCGVNWRKCCFLPRDTFTNRWGMASKNEPDSLCVSVLTHRFSEIVVARKCRFPAVSTPLKKEWIKCDDLNPLTHWWVPDTNYPCTCSSHEGGLRQGFSGEAPLFNHFTMNHQHRRLPMETGPNVTQFLQVSISLCWFCRAAPSVFTYAGSKEGVARKKK